MHSNYVVRCVLIATAFLALAACGKPPANAAFQNRGAPESLLDVSSEVVSLGIGSGPQITELKTWLDRDYPTRAELHCLNNDKYCSDAKRALEKKSVPYVMGSAGAQTVTLVYERIVARDCNPRYVDNPHNFYNTNHPAFGCAVTANIVQHVTDKQEFINPSLSDDPSAVRGVNDIRRAYTPRPIVAPYKLDDSLVGKAKTQ